jgi:hypothetical protein
MTLTGRFPCAFCEAEFDTEELLISHRRQLHGGSGPHFTCDACGKEFAQAEQLDEHTRAGHGQADEADPVPD